MGTLVMRDQPKLTRWEWVFILAVVVAPAWIAAAHSAEAAPAHHRRAPGLSLAACEAGVRAQWASWPDDAPEPVPYSPEAIQSARDNPQSYGAAGVEFMLAENTKMALLNPGRTRSMMIDTTIEHDCHGGAKYLDQPMDRTVTITGKVYYDGSVQATVQ